MSNPNEADDSPDFSFLGGDTVPESTEDFDFSSAEGVEEPSNVPEVPDVPSAPQVSDMPEFPDPTESGLEDAVENVSDLNFDAETAAADSVKPEAIPTEPAAPVEPPAPPKKPAIRRLKPRSRAPRPVETPTEVAEAGDATTVSEDRPTQTDEPRPGQSTDETSDQSPATESQAPDADNFVSKKAFTLVASYAAALTLLFIALIATGRLALTGSHPLESLPDVAPLREGEFQKVTSAEGDTGFPGLPSGHLLALGTSQRFGDVILTPVRVTREPLEFVSMLTGAPDKDRKTGPVLKLWFRLKNVSSDFAFPPWDVSLMASRNPAEGTDDATSANSWLLVTQGSEEKRFLNYLHSPNSSFDLTDQSSRKIVQPGEELETYIACTETIAHVTTADSYRWRLQIRKGVNQASGNSVTTLVDVVFSQDDIES